MEHEIDRIRGKRTLAAIGVSRSTGDGKRERSVAVVGTSQAELAEIIAELFGGERQAQDADSSR